MTFLLALFLSASPAQADVCFNPFSGDRPSTKSECWDIYARKSHKCVGACVADCEQFENKCDSLPDQEAQAVDYATYDYGGTEAEHYYGGHGEYPDTGDHGGEAVALPSEKEQLLATWTGMVQDGGPVGDGSFAINIRYMGSEPGIPAAILEYCYYGTWEAGVFKGEQYRTIWRTGDFDLTTRCDPRIIPRIFGPIKGEWVWIPGEPERLSLHNGIDYGVVVIEQTTKEGLTTRAFGRRCSETRDGVQVTTGVKCELEGFKSFFTIDEYNELSEQTVTRDLPRLTEQDEAKADGELKTKSKKKQGAQGAQGATEDDSCMGCSTGRAASFGWWGLFGLTMLLARRRRA